METIILSAARRDEAPLLLPCLQALFPECRILVAGEGDRVPGETAADPPERGEDAASKSATRPG